MRYCHQTKRIINVRTIVVFRILIKIKSIKTMKINKKIYTISALIVLATLAGSLPVSAEITTSNGIKVEKQDNHSNKIRNGGMMKPAVVGQVTAISGNTITITSKQGFDRKNNTTTAPTVTTITFTIDATNAKIEKGNVAGTIGNIVVGDTIMVQGTVAGTNVVATNIRDGIARGQDQNKGKNNDNKNVDQQIPANIQGNGLPVIAGSITSISGNSIVVTNKSNVTYTVDATSAKIIQGGNTTATISNIAVGDMVLVQGTVNGNAVVASSVVDQKLATSTTTETATKSHGFFAGIGAFFSHLFGY